MCGLTEDLSILFVVAIGLDYIVCCHVYYILLVGPPVLENVSRYSE